MTPERTTKPSNVLYYVLAVIVALAIGSLILAILQMLVVVSKFIIDHWVYAVVGLIIVFILYMWLRKKRR